MAYDPTKWEHGDLIIANKLNKIESALSNISDNAVFDTDGLSPTGYVNSGDPMPANPKKGTSVFVKDGNDFLIYSFDGTDWVLKVDPDLSNRIGETIKTASDNTDKAIADNNTQINETINQVAKEQADLAVKDGDFNNKAQAMADKALADAKYNTTQVAQDALNSANQNLADAKKSLTDDIAQEASDRASAVSALDTKAQGYVDAAKKDISDTVNAFSFGGRNYILNSSGMNASSTTRPVLRGTTSDVSLATITYDSDAITLTNPNSNTSSEWYYQLATAWQDITKTPLIAGKQYALAVDVMGTAKQVALRWGSKEISPYQSFKAFDINNTSWTRVVWTFTLPVGTLNTYLRIHGAINNQYASGFTGGETLRFRYVKLESGNKPTDWTNAPEDVVLDYTTKDNKIKETITQYQETNDGLVSKAQTDATTALGLVETKISKTVYDQKTGELTQAISKAQTTADGAVSTVGNYQTSNDGRVKAAESKIEQNATDITARVSQTDYNQKTGKLSGDISTLQQRADGFDATVTKVDNLSVGGSNLFVLATASKGWLDVSYNVTAPGDASLASDFIPVTANTTYIAQQWYIMSHPTGGGYLRYVFYDSSKIPISRVPAPANNNATYSKWVITTPVNTAFIRMSFDYTANNGSKVKFEQGNLPTDWTPAPEDVQSALAQVKITADGVSSIVSNPTTGLSTRVQTAEGTLNTVKSTADGAMSKASQTANDITQEIKDRGNGDSNTLQSSKDFTQSSITSAVKGVNSTITQTSESLIAKINTKTDSDTVLSLLKNNWSIGITDNISKITSGIVGNASQMSLISKNVTIDSPNTQIKGTAWIQSAMIANGAIGSAQIGDASITSAKIAQLDVAKLTGDVTSFVKSYWNSAYGNVTITPDKVSLQSYSGSNLVSQMDIGNMGIFIKMPGVSSFLDSTLINANGMSFQHNNGSYATIGVMDSGFSLENNTYGGSPMSIRIGDGVNNTADDMAFAITASQSYGTSPQLIWAGSKVGKITTAYRTWDNPHGFILADDIKFSTWDNTASTVIFDETVNYQNWSPNQTYGYIDSTGTKRWFKVAGYNMSSTNRVVGIFGGDGKNGVAVDQTGDVWFSVKGKTYSLHTMLSKLGML